ncbi:MAG: glycosyltransferase family 4 protein, partial [Gammaproteobacteria bacterium]|nr:glycosyltransferase family 4 protein [Gammaproteobacteria bacterium]
LDQLIDTLDLRDRVTLTGHLSDAEIAGLWRTCDAFCLPSIERTEAFGLVLLEAMRFGKPVIASDIPGSGVGWVVAQGRHGLRVEPNDPAALRAAIQRLKEQPGLRLRLGQAGGAALGRQFHINQVAGQMLHLYRDLYDSTHRTGSARKTSARA